MTDRELLERAAKAAGIDFAFNDDGTPSRFTDGSYELAWGYGRWHPLADNEAAFCLAVKLHINVVFRTDDVKANKAYNDSKYREFYGNDPYAATRRAIVRAAAEIGRTM